MVTRRQRLIRNAGWALIALGVLSLILGFILHFTHTLAYPVFTREPVTPGQYFAASFLSLILGAWVFWKSRGIQRVD